MLKGGINEKEPIIKIYIFLAFKFFQIQRFNLSRATEEL